jgi:hypothetical protein
MKANFLYLAVLFFIGCTESNQNQHAQTPNPEDTSITMVNLVDLLASAKDYDGKEVIITGTATHVCKHSGKRLHLLAGDEKTMIRLEAGEIGQFDRELEGSNIIAKGIFHRDVIDEEYLAKWADEMDQEGKGMGKRMGKGNHKSDEEAQEEEGRMKQYKGMMGETSEGHLENFWVEGISFETVTEEPSI